MKYLLAIILITTIGCGAGMSETDAGPAACSVPPDTTKGYHDCGVQTASGLECLEGCGWLPSTGEGKLITGLPCTLDITVSGPETGLCVASCSDCGAGG